MSTPRFMAEELDELRQLAAAWGKIVSKTHRHRRSPVLLVP
ncbi:hypothetical protein [Frigoriglobus tundricola]|uniref:Uncharacterized protein n=1 Tax=Frigoriglobus tundricola TaxID=2774151 RepID=A0A6M5YSC3_9BACT|nr:hypothetical protein [Frigoriglobus tundricola]QJW96977.1 hypothetical protein FTUN_4537 [Frigoriglobus tundricola]